MYLIHVINRLYTHTALYKVTYKSSQKAHLIAVNGRRSNSPTAGCHAPTPPDEDANNKNQEEERRQDRNGQQGETQVERVQLIKQEETLTEQTAPYETALIVDEPLTDAPLAIIEVIKIVINRMNQ